ncbi:SGNH/GDSL hydrolase family protein [Actinoplanes sp. NPDC051851]|uniref:SGNH/GDSL hydrolase family protein n=1 Tax=Actinoplanes sp. NPDC051851 TaxID=3154753 RepID=UPI00343C15FD
MVSRRDILTASAGAAASAALPGTTNDEHGAGRAATWVATWAAVPTTIPPTEPLVLANQTVRHVVHTSLGGDRLRIRLTNEFGDTPLRIGEAHVAIRGTSTDRRVTFGGREAVTVPAGAPVVSDPVELRIGGGTDLEISVYLPERTPVSTLAAFAFQDNVIASGNVTADREITPTAVIQQYLFLSGVSVSASGGAIVALGDSITNGANTVANANHRWPDLLAERLRYRNGVANLGVSGNRLLHDPNPPDGNPAVAYANYFGHSALRRFDRDVLAQPGAAFLIVLLGVNDLGHPGTSAPLDEVVTADDLIWGHRQLVTRAHVAGLRAYGGTILPFKGDTLNFWSEENERKRGALNDWIRRSGEYDGVIDFDRAVRDPADPLRLAAAYDSGDHLHPNDTGMAAMAVAIPLELFKRR